ncbi:hypothetical protein Clacol_003389 [Clathrus columnatus]|uniref:Retrotransposon Copia-like N-terminal domain-containing protein n=1 Tax=Clathrus columnatus TaxID=1419009 RepID=A0AAV5A3I0_9AGAM|nr:hypothetical protein Clacol_003389 [Clathrus columnatus]
MSYRVNIPLNLLTKVADLNTANWFTWSKQMKMFFLGCNTPQVTTGTLPTDAAQLAKFNVMNALLTAHIYSKVLPEHLHIIEDETTATSAWAKLKAHFKKPTVGHRMAAWRAFYYIRHDPEQPISKYIQDVSATCAKLKTFGCTVTDTKLIDVLLMNLDESLHHIHAIILSQKEEPDLSSVKNILIGANSHSADVKMEYDTTLLAHSSRNSSHGCSPHSHESPSNNGPSSPPPVDEQGYRWCDTTNKTACHCCGCKRHKAAHCMYSMPVRDIGDNNDAYIVM